MTHAEIEELREEDHTLPTSTEQWLCKILLQIGMRRYLGRKAEWFTQNGTLMNPA